MYIIHAQGWRKVLKSEWASKVETILKGSLNSVKIQIMGGKVCLKCKGKILLGIINKFLKTKSLLTSPTLFCLITSSKLSHQ
jgi:hypothetical protein